MSDQDTAAVEGIEASPTEQVPGADADDALAEAPAEQTAAATEDLSDEVIVRCALGAQATGIAALGNIGLAVNSNAAGAVSGSVCTLDGLPVEGYPYCWSTGGFWGYWAAADQSAEWGFSTIGAGSGPLTEGSVIGFAWAQGFEGDAPRVAPDGTPTA